MTKLSLFTILRHTPKISVPMFTENTGCSLQRTPTGWWWTEEITALYCENYTKYINKMGEKTQNSLLTLNLFIYLQPSVWAGIAQSVQLYATGLDGPGIESGRGEIFRTCPDRPWGPPSLLHNGYRVSFPRVKRPGRDIDHPPTSSAEVKEIAELYLSCPSGLSWPVLGWTVPVPLPFTAVTAH
jgi:hypothetical protein